MIIFTISDLILLTAIAYGTVERHLGTGCDVPTSVPYVAQDKESARVFRGLNA